MIGLVSTVPGADGVHPRLDHRFAHQLLGGVAGPGRHQQPPQARHADEHEPGLGVGDIGDRREVLEMGREIVFRRGAEPELGEGQPRKLDPRADADYARCAVGGDQITPGQGLRATRPVHVEHDHAIGILAGGDRSGGEPDFGLLHPLQDVDDDTVELVLLGLHPVGVAGVVLQDAEVPLGDDAARGVAVLPDGADYALGDQRLDHAELVQHVEGRRVEGRGAEVERQAVAGLDQGHRDAGARERQRGDAADRTRPRDQNAILGPAQPILATARSIFWRNASSRRSSRRFTP